MADPKYSKPPEPCGSCRFRSEFGTWHCNYSDIMGVTKHKTHPAAAPGALAGPGCLCYQRGKRRLRPSRVSRKAPKKPEKRPALEAQEARWEAMRLMYLQGGNDVQIAEELGCATGTVRHWRHRQCLPPNGRDGWDK